MESATATRTNMHRTVTAALALVATVATVATTASAGEALEPGPLVFPPVTGAESVQRTAAGAAVHGEAGTPQQPSLRLFRAWLAAFNSGDRRRYATFLRRSFPSRLPSLNEEMAIRELTGGFTLRKLQGVSARRVSGLVEWRDADYFGRFQLTVSARTPRKILTLPILTIRRPAEFPIARVTEGEAIAGVEALLRKRAAADMFSGAALVAKSGRILFSGAYGLADRERGISNTLETRFRIASMTKMFTAVATLQLVEAGRLALDDPVGKHLPGYPNAEVASKVTVRHLLTHTGGTGDFFGQEFDQNRLTLREHSDYVKLFGSRPPRFEPGSRFDYSNYGFVLLGAIIEAVSGRSYYDYVRENVFLPSGMTSTDSLPESEDVPNRSIGYFTIGGVQIPNTLTLPWRGNAACCAYSTVGDLARFADALRRHQLLSPASTELLLAGRIDLGDGIRYAFGFVDARDEDGNGWVGHAGAGLGMNGDLRIYHDPGTWSRC
jgi:D-alanyl-D-alanine carboxypeptidase